MHIKCWLHGGTAPKEQNKPLKEHPGWPDKTKDYQQNIALILNSTKKEPYLKPYRWWDFQVLVEEKNLLLKQKENIKTLEKQVKSLLDKQFPIAEFKEQILILKDLFTKADLPNTFNLLLESWEELVKINNTFANLGTDSLFSDDEENSNSDEETNSSESGSESGEESGNDTDGLVEWERKKLERLKRQRKEQEKERLAREKAEAEKQEQKKKEQEEKLAREKTEQEEAKKRQKQQEEEETKQAERAKELKKWQNISLDFTEKLVQEWKNNGFSYETCKEWMDIGLGKSADNIKNALACAWLRDNKNLTPEQVLNYENREELGQEYGKFKIEKEIEEYKTQILTILDGWKDNSVGFERHSTKIIIKVLANESLPSEKQFKELQAFLNKFPSNNIELNNLVKSWSKKNQEIYQISEIEIYFEPISAQREEIKETSGMMTRITYKMTVEVAERGEYRNEGSHIIGEVWSPSAGTINTYGEDDDPQPGNLKGKPLKTVILPGLGSDTSKNWVEAINESENKKGTHRNSAEVFKVKGEIENYDEITATLTFKQNAEIEGIMEKLPL